MIEALSLSEITINFLEACIFTYLVWQCLPLRFHFYSIPLLMVSNCCLTTLCSHLISDASIRSITLLALSAILIFFVSKDAKWNVVIVSIVYSTFAFFSEEITLVILQSIPNFSVYNAIHNMTAMRYISCGIYLLVFLLLSVLFIKIKRKVLMNHSDVFSNYSKKNILCLLVLLCCCTYLMDQYFINIAHISQIKDTALYPYISSLKKIGYLFVILLILIFSLLIYTYYLNQLNIKLIREQQQISIEKKQLQFLSESNSLLRTWKHDNQNILNTINHYLQGGNIEQAIHLLSEYQSELATSTEIKYTGFAVLDAVLSMKTFAIKNAGIHFRQKLFLSKNLSLPITDVQMCSLLSNLLDNAIEACEKVAVNPFINLCIQTAKMNLILTIQNSSDGRYNYTEDGQLQSTKEAPEHGLGLIRIKEIVETANGIYKISPKQDIFEITILLPLEDTEYDNQNMCNRR